MKLLLLSADVSERTVCKNTLFVLKDEVLLVVVVTRATTTTKNTGQNEKKEKRQQMKKKKQKVGSPAAVLLADGSEMVNENVKWKKEEDGDCLWQWKQYKH